jgi:transcriptional regulator with XRE-family HTH domain
MNTSCDFLDAVKARHAIISDYKLAKLMGVGQQTISNYRNGRSTLDDSMVLRVAGLLEEDPAVMLAAVHAERAKRPEEKAAWRSIMERLGGVAACAILGVALVYPTPSQASPVAPDRPALKIM